MAQFVATPPPYVKDGKFLSAYFTNQLSETVNAVGGAIYGANVPRWIEYSGDTLQAMENIYSIVHKYDTLKIKFGFGNTDMIFKVYLTTDDGVLGTKIYEDTTTSDGPLTLTFDLSTNPNGFSVDVGQLYFIRIYASESGESSDFWSIEFIREVSTGTIVKPTLSNITSASVLNETYLNSLVDAARDLRLKIQPTVLPFIGWNLIGSTGRDNTYIRYKMRHLSRWLHYGMKGADSGGGADGIKVWFNNTILANFDNDGSYYFGAWDMTNLPNAIAEPGLGVEYEIKFEVVRASGVFQLFNLWELPYL